MICLLRVADNQQVMKIKNYSVELAEHEGISNILIGLITLIVTFIRSNSLSNQS